MSKSSSLMSITSFRSSPAARGYESHIVEQKSVITDPDEVSSHKIQEKTEEDLVENESNEKSTDATSDDEIVPIDANAESVEIIRQKLTSMGDLRFLKKVKKINFRWNLIKKIEGLDHIGSTLVELILVDNQVCYLLYLL